MVEYPDVAAFDLDYTVWPCHCDTHLCPPFKAVKSPNGEVLTVVDSRGFVLKLFRDIPKIFCDLLDNDVKLVSASRTWAPEIAKDLLKLYKIEYNGKLISLKELFVESEWGERSKTGHLRDAVKKLYGHENLKKYKMCLFDDEGRNRDVEKQGVKFVYVKDPEHGPTWKLYQDYLNGKL
ncbi:hypothetical protein TBLA_0A08820 [Henningerozyma blattae CBS 6284]|uniref:Magnesium-dependent phosphatase-1 n=1 Tax=Henningerozyma blattae (strain ATCC 34711 / CBS 6284 / DSM 70876 / NBRC 10599 / NRRL Y-10934 / UCD 77-7) TaxID=1071380 RepID=I2GX19_HENB6|nr:hypothetical protein TBLA_0A08820 [Tetrapisispora blattae CBS 6284]CCH58671.1 hypothetical protein TBLA_0A08820 [Tetrapisispora blattae CBS 6284]